MAYRGRIVAQAEIFAIEETEAELRISSTQEPFPARALVHYSQGWRPARKDIPFRGCQAIRHLDTMGLRHLDFEEMVDIGGGFRWLKPLLRFLT